MMDWEKLNLIAAAPEIVLLCLLSLVLLVDLFLDNQRRWITYGLTQIGLLITLAVQWYVFRLPENQSAAFGGMFVNDGVAHVAKVLMYVATIFLFAYTRHYLKARQMYQGEYYTLTLFALIGMCMMVSAEHFILLYIGLELLSLSLYTLIALRREDAQASEAALKYFVLGSLASGMLLYGISLIYGGSGGQLDLPVVLGVLYAGQGNGVLIQLGLIFIAIGIAFKFGAVPFHMWVPDVYQGAPVAITAFVASIPKIAATVFAFRILVTGLATEFIDWSQMFMILAVASLLVGNLAAIMQTNIKRMLAYSTISHMGFILLAFVGNNFVVGDGQSFSGLSAAIYYAVTYILMSLVAFGVLLALSAKDRECENIADLAGLNHRHPWYAFLMLLAMFSMAGIPPLMGFYAKVYVILALLEQNLIALAVFAVIMSLIGAFYYLRIVKVMYFDEPEENPVQVVSMCWSARFLLSANGLMLIAFGIVPYIILDWCSQYFVIG